LRYSGYLSRRAEYTERSPTSGFSEKNRKERRAAQKRSAAAAAREEASIAPLLAQASELHRAGRPVEAEALCGQILKTQPSHAKAYRRRFPDDPTMVNLDRWHAYEQEQPDTFAGMYQFWIAKG
jgi:hypothetical protein